MKEAKPPPIGLSLYLIKPGIFISVGMDIAQFSRSEVGWWGKAKDGLSQK